MATVTGQTLTDVLDELETCVNVLDNVGFLPTDLESTKNSAARFVIYRVVVNEVMERMSQAILKLCAVINGLTK